MKVYVVSMGLVREGDTVRSVHACKRGAEIAFDKLVAATSADMEMVYLSEWPCDGHAGKELKQSRTTGTFEDCEW